MTVYLSLLGLLFISIIPFTNFANGELSQKKKRLAFRYATIIIIIMIVIQSMRDYSVGGDLLDSYYGSYLALGQLTIKEIIRYQARAGIGYLLFVKVVYVLSGGSFRIFLAVISTLYLLSLLRILKKYSKNIIFSLFLFVALGLFNSSMNNLKSTLAMTIILWGLPELIKKKYVKFFLAIILSATFHITTLSFVFLLSALSIKKRKIKEAFIFMLGLFMIFGFSLFTKVINRFLPAYTTYIENDSSGSGYNLFIFLVFIAVFIWMYTDKYFLMDTKNKTFFTMYICGILLQIISFRIAYFERTVSYHLIALCFIIPSMLDSVKIRENGFVLLCICVGFWGFYIFTLMQNSTGTVPYLFMIGDQL